MNLLQSRKCIGGSQIRESHLVMFSDRMEVDIDSGLGWVDGG